MTIIHHSNGIFLIEYFSKTMNFLQYYGEKLFHEFIINAWVVMEQAHLWWIQTNQGTLRANVYKGLVDTIGDVANEDIDLQNLS